MRYDAARTSITGEWASQANWIQMSLAHDVSGWDILHQNWPSAAIIKECAIRAVRTGTSAARTIRRWSHNDLHTLSAIQGSNFEVVQMGTIVTK